jgi:hypothetical protein
VIFPHLPQFEGKAMGGRAAAYPVTGGFAALMLRTRLGPWAVFGLVVGFGAVTAVVWELLEYVTFIRNSPELKTAYHDTLGDLTLGLSGSVVSATVAALLARRRPA